MKALSDIGSQEAVWDDPYLIAVADQLDWWFATTWNRLTAVDSSLGDGALGDVLQQLRDDGLNTDFFEVHALDAEALSPTVRALLPGLRRNLTRVRRAGRRAYREPLMPVMELACIEQWPLVRTRLPDRGEPVDRIVLLELNDLPIGDPDWHQRDRITDLSALKYLALEGYLVDEISLGIDFSALEALRILNLERNAFLRLPESLLCCRALESLILYDNPDIGADLTPERLSSFPNLRHLDIRSTGVSPVAIQALREAMPRCMLDVDP